LDHKEVPVSLNFCNVIVLVPLSIGSSRFPLETVGEEKLETYMRDGMKAYQDVCRKNKEFLNHPHPIVRLYASCGQTYLSMGGHANAAGEVIFVLDYASRQFLPMIGEIKGRFDKLMQDIGMAPLGVGRDARTWTETPAHFAMAKILKGVVDPKGFMAPGVAFPPE